MSGTKCAIYVAGPGGESLRRGAPATWLYAISLPRPVLSVWIVNG
jgi:hypothetical protein